MHTQQSAYEYFRHIASMLHDDEPARPFVRFKIEDLINAYNQGMAVVYAYRPDLFTIIRRVKLSPGVHQDFNEQCDNILQVLEQVNEHGDLIKPVHTERTNAPFGGKRAAWSLKRTPTIPREGLDGAPIEYTIDSVTIQPDVNTSFNVHPPVPQGVDVYVNIKCIRPPTPIRYSAIDDTVVSSAVHSVAVSHYIMAKMLMGNRDAAGYLQESRYHFDLFKEVLQIEASSEQTVERVQQE